MEEKELSASQFADTIEIPRAILSHILSERNKPSLEVIIKIIAAFRDISIPWLLMGEGSMLGPAPGKSKSNLPGMMDQIQGEDAGEGSLKESPVVEKVQEGSLSQAILNSLFASSKSIEQVMIFYSDKTFSIYKPE